MFHTYLEQHRDEIRAIDLELAAYMCVTSIEALSHNAVLHCADFASDEDYATLADEATRLIVGYLGV